ncbi:MAG: hypothetical protein HYV68_02350 [Candidatus Taylorbacteria bacterium]|nr:hypothetical protein [Candidatus Taylorbacteria bacterium]
MSLIDKIEELRKLPEVSRRRILVASTFSITAVIFFLWVSIRFYDTGSPSPAAAEKDVGPIVQAGEAIGDFWETMRTDFASVGEAIKDTASSSDATSTEEQASRIIESESTE